MPCMHVRTRSTLVYSGLSIFVAIVAAAVLYLVIIACKYSQIYEDQKDAALEQRVDEIRAKMPPTVIVDLTSSRGKQLAERLLQIGYSPTQVIASTAFFSTNVQMVIYTRNDLIESNSHSRK